MMIGFIIGFFLSAFLALGTNSLLKLASDWRLVAKSYLETFEKSLEIASILLPPIGALGGLLLSLTHIDQFVEGNL